MTRLLALAAMLALTACGTPVEPEPDAGPADGVAYECSRVGSSTCGGDAIDSGDTVTVCVEGDGERITYLGGREDICVLPDGVQCNSGGVPVDPCPVPCLQSCSALACISEGPCSRGDLDVTMTWPQ